MAKVTNKALAKSSIASIAANMWRIISRFFLTPLIIAKIGIAGYGIWSLIFSIEAQIGVVNTSIGVAYAKLTAEYDSKGDYKTLTSLLSSGIILISGFALLVLPSIWFFRFALLNFLNVPEASIDEAARALLIVTSVVLLRFSFGCVFRVLEGLQRHYLLSILKIIGSFIDFSVTILLLILGYGLLGLAVGFAVGEITTLIIARCLCYKIEPRIGINPFHPSVSGFSEILKLGGKFQLLGILSTLLLEGSKMLVSILFGVEILAQSQLASKLMKLGRSVGNSILNPLLAAFSNLHTQIDAKNRLANFYLQVSRVISSANGLCLSFLAIFADDIVFLWTGGGYSLAVWTIRVTAIISFLTIINGVGTSSLRARGMIRLEFITGIISAIIGFGSAWPMAQMYGYKGVVIGFFSGNLIAWCIFFLQYHRFEKYPIWAYFKQVIMKPILILIPCIVLFILLKNNIDITLFHLRPRIKTLIEITIWGVLYTTVVAMMFRYFLLSHEEYLVIKEKILCALRIKNKSSASHAV